METKLPTPRMVYRALAGDGARERIGAGIMDKSGVSLDWRLADAPTWSLVHVLRGKGVYHDHTGAVTELGPGSCFIRRPGWKHSTILDPASSWLEVFVDLGDSLYRTLAHLNIIRGEPYVWTVPKSQSRVGDFVALVDDLAGAEERQLPDLCARAIQLVVAMQGSAPKMSDSDEPDAIEQACRQLSDESVRRVDLRALCRKSGLDYERFRKEFLRRLGMPPGQYRIRRRIDHACQLLQTTKRSLADIAEQLGYASPYEFSAQFRKHLGLPPSHYRSGK